MRTTFPKLGNSGGYTLIEIAIGALLFALMMSMMGIVTTTSHSLYRSTAQSGALDSKAGHTLAKLGSEITEIGGSMMNPDPTSQFGTRLTLGPDAFTYQQATGVAGGVVQWGPLMRLEFEYEPGEVDDGVDNNSNGLVDEGMVVLTRDPGGPNQLRAVLCRGVMELAPGELINNVDDNGNGVVDEGGFNLQRVGDVMIIRLWLTSVGANAHTIERENQIAVRLRNLGA